MLTTRTIKEWRDFVEFWHESTQLELKSDAPAKEQAFYLFRGVNDSTFALESRLTRFVRDNGDGLNYGAEWRTRICALERELLNRFLDEIEPCPALKEQYAWFNPPNPKTDTFWYLSVMQHHGCPTRLVDFTADFWASVFFALDDIKEGKNPAIYRLKCKNEDENDHGGNKLPRDSSGRPWENQNGRDMNQLLGQIIEYDGFRNPHGDFWQSHPKWSSPTQRFGWDTPKVQIARIRRQKGFFVYNLDARRTLQEDIDDSPNMEKLSIDHSLVSKIKEELCKRGYHDLVLYLDLDRTFLKWTEQLRAKR